MLEIDDDSDFSSLQESLPLTGTSVTLSTPLDSETTYYWQVRGVNDCGNGVVSETRSFTTGTLICAAPDLAIPDNDAGGIDSPAELDYRRRSD